MRATFVDGVLIEAIRIVMHNGRIEFEQAVLDEAAALVFRFVGCMPRQVGEAWVKVRVVLGRLVAALQIPSQDDQERPSGQRRAIRGVYRLEPRNAS